MVGNSNCDEKSPSIFILKIYNVLRSFTFAYDELRRDSYSASNLHLIFMKLYFTTKPNSEITFHL